jgi:hypothetical protein
MDDVAEFEIQWEEITLGERVGLGTISRSVNYLNFFTLLNYSGDMVFP